MSSLTLTPPASASSPASVSAAAAAAAAAAASAPAAAGAPAPISTTVRVGVGVLVQSPDCNCLSVLFGRRKGSHGAGTYALPGGHLEVGESWEACAIREVKEETNLDVENLHMSHVVNSPNMGGDPSKHYVTIFMHAVVAATSAPLTNMEPHKCEGWEWMPWDDIVAKRRDTPGVLFDPMLPLVDHFPEGTRSFKK